MDKVIKELKDNFNRTLEKHEKDQGITNMLFKLYCEEILSNLSKMSARVKELEEKVNGSVEGNDGDGSDGSGTEDGKGSGSSGDNTGNATDDSGSEGGDIDDSIKDGTLANEEDDSSSGGSAEGVDLGGADA